MKILEQALNKINLNKHQIRFFITAITGFIGIIGKRTFRNLSRYTSLHEKTFSRQMKKAFDFIVLNCELIQQTTTSLDILIAAQDSCFQEKSGKHTYGLGIGWNGSEGKVDKGLEIDTIAIVNVHEHSKTYTLSTEQISLKKQFDQEKHHETKIDLALKHMKKVQSSLQKLGVKHCAADAFYAKVTYISGMTNLGIDVITKLRKDARLRKVYQGEQKSRGRKKLYEQIKIDNPDFINPIIIPDPENSDEYVELKEVTAYHLSFKRIIKVVSAAKFIKGKKSCTALLSSTDLSLSALQIYQFYTSRFQIEFIFRDAKGFTGLEDCQSTNEQRLNFHFNLSLTALNVIRIMDCEKQQKQKTSYPFSATNWNRQYLMQIVLERFICMFGFDLTLIKSDPRYQEALSFANIKH